MKILVTWAAEFIRFYSPSTSISKGISEFIKWFRAYYKVPVSTVTQ